MKKVYILLAEFLFSITFSAKSFAAFSSDDRIFYLGARVGMDWTDYELEVKTSTIGNTQKEKYSLDNAKSNNFGLIGGIESKYFRLEGEFLFVPKIKKSGEKIDIKGYSAFATGYLQYPVTEYFSPYVNIGLGITVFKMDNVLFDDEDIQAAASSLVGFGATVYPARNFAIDLGYRYIYYGDFEEEETVYISGNFAKITSNTEIGSSELYLSFRYLF